MSLVRDRIPLVWGPSPGRHRPYSPPIHLAECPPPKWGSLNGKGAVKKPLGEGAGLALEGRHAAALLTPAWRAWGCCLRGTMLQASSVTSILLAGQLTAHPRNRKEPLGTCSHRTG